MEIEADGPKGVVSVATRFTVPPPDSPQSGLAAQVVVGVWVMTGRLLLPTVVELRFTMQGFSRLDLVEQVQIRQLPADDEAAGETPAGLRPNDVSGGAGLDSVPSLDHLMVCSNVLSHLSPRTWPLFLWVSVK